MRPIIQAVLLEDVLNFFPERAARAAPTRAVAHKTATTKGSRRIIGTSDGSRRFAARRGEADISARRAARPNYA